MLNTEKIQGIEPMFNRINLNLAIARAHEAIQFEETINNMVLNEDDE